ncbi:hypothetical protein RDABS01_036362 [Bienertia sinuspersici]
MGDDTRGRGMNKRLWSLEEENALWFVGGRGCSSGFVAVRLGSSLFFGAHRCSITSARPTACPPASSAVQRLDKNNNGAYEYVDMIVGEERLIIDIDFRLEFEVARSTKT